MLNNRHKNSICDFAEPLVTYLYGEISNAEKFKFEAHLKNCSACSDELAEFGFVRSMVREWRIEEFDGLPTPAFEILLHDVKTPLTSESSRFWFYSLSRIFSFKPAFAAAFAVLITFAGITFLMFESAEKNHLAGKKSDTMTIKTDVSPSIEKVKEQQIRVADNDSVKTETVPRVNIKPKDLPVKIADRKSSTENKSATKVSVSAPKINKDSNNNKRSPVVKKQNFPRLTEAEETEDNSIRLADLFDEIETR